MVDDVGIKKIFWVGFSYLTSDGKRREWDQIEDPRKLMSNYIICLQTNAHCLSSKTYNFRSLFPLFKFYPAAYILAPLTKYDPLPMCFGMSGSWERSSRSPISSFHITILQDAEEDRPKTTICPRNSAAARWRASGTVSRKARTFHSA